MLLYCVCGLNLSDMKSWTLSKLYLSNTVSQWKITFWKSQFSLLTFHFSHPSPHFPICKPTFKFDFCFLKSTFDIWFWLFTLNENRLLILTFYFRWPLSAALRARLRLIPYNGLILTSVPPCFRWESAQAHNPTPSLAPTPKWSPGSIR